MGMTTLKRVETSGVGLDENDHVETSVNEVVVLVWMGMTTLKRVETSGVGLDENDHVETS
jgi:hypothetical protein